MVRKIIIALAASAAVLSGSTLAASARMGGGGHGGHMGGHMGSHMSSHVGARMGGFGRAGVAHGTFRQFSGVRAVNHARVDHRLVLRHNRHHRRFVFFAGAYPYYAYDNCYARVWTPYGWRWSYVCGDYGYGY
jgi:hypothetical protein